VHVVLADGLQGCQVDHLRYHHARVLKYVSKGAQQVLVA
jgi:predicted membrane-bound spermidine synthase